MTEVDPTRHRLRAALTRLHSGDPIADCLRDCIAIGVEYDAGRLLTWARAELTGYPDGAKVPDYRRVRVELIGIRRSELYQQTGPVGLEEYESGTRDWVLTNRQSIRSTVEDIAAIVQQARASREAYVVASSTADQHHLLKPGRDTYEQVYWGVYAAAFDKILDEVRKSAVGMLEELDNSVTQADPAAESEAAGTQAFHVHVAGVGHQFSVTANQNGTGNAGADDGGDLARRSLAWAKWQVYLAAIGLPIAIISAVLAFLALRPETGQGADKAQLGQSSQVLQLSLTGLDNTCHSVLLPSGIGSSTNPFVKVTKQPADADKFMRDELNLGGYAHGELIARINAQTSLSQEVTINDVKLIDLAVAEPVAGALVNLHTCGGEPVNDMVVYLNRPDRRPFAVDEQGHDTDRRFFDTEIVNVAPGKKQSFVIRVTTDPERTAGSYTFKLGLVYEVDGSMATAVVDDNGHPFRLTAGCAFTTVTDSWGLQNELMRQVDPGQYAGVECS